MKITWFGDATFRLYVGGQIIVTDHLKAPAGIDGHELTAGADVLIDVESVLPDITAFTQDNWRRQRAKSLLEEGTDPAPPHLFALEGKALIADSDDEARLIVAFGAVTWDRFADDAVVILTDPEQAANLARSARPKLICLAVANLSDEAFDAFAQNCRDCAIQVLEPGFALEA